MNYQSFTMCYILINTCKKQKKVSVLICEILLYSVTKKSCGLPHFAIKYFSTFDTLEKGIKRRQEILHHFASFFIVKNVGYINYLSSPFHNFLIATKCKNKGIAATKAANQTKGKYIKAILGCSKANC